MLPLSTAKEYISILASYNSASWISSRQLQHLHIHAFISSADHSHITCNDQLCNPIQASISVYFHCHDTVFQIPFLDLYPSSTKNHLVFPFFIHLPFISFHFILGFTNDLLSVFFICEFLPSVHFLRVLHPYAYFLSSPA
jgi:hypothetical protein